MSPEPSASACPGCGAVLADAAPPARPHPGASAACARLFDVTLRGVRQEGGGDPSSACTARLADDAYDAQHAVPEGMAPRAWQMTIADVAADLDVIDLAVLVESWASTVREDCARTPVEGG